MIRPCFCRQCGTRLPTDSLFCPSCGTSQQTTDQSLTFPTPPQPVRNQQPPHMGTGRLPTGVMLRNRYRLLEKVGQGGMGAVYVAQDTQLGDRLVAVKEMSMSRLSPQELPQAVELFKREAHLLASLHHINLPVIYDHFGEQDRWYLVMSFIQGSTLQAYLENAPGKKLPVTDVVQIGIELCNVLDYLHNHQPQIIFRDLKPLNIMVTPQKQVYLIDFGIARHFKQDQSRDTAYYYSVGYAPPEQYGQSQTGPRSDIYSLGATLHQMLSGHNPSSKPFNFVSLQLLDPTIPVPLAQLIIQMLDMNEQQRPPSMAAVRAELEKVLNPVKIGETRAVDYQKKTEDDSKEAVQKAAEDRKKLEAAPKQTEKNAPGFLQKRLVQITLWISFSVLCVIFGIVGGLAISDGASSSWAYISGLGSAAVGIALLFAKGRRWAGIIGGLLFVAFSNLILVSVYSPWNISCASYDSQYSYYYDCHLSRSMQIEQTIIPLSLFLLVVGCSLLIRKTNNFVRLLFSASLLVSGIYFASTHYDIFSSYYDDYEHSPAAGVWQAQATLGAFLFLIVLIVVIVKAARKKSARARER